MRKHTLSILRVLISVSLIALLLYLMRGEYDKIVNVLKSTSIRLFSLALAVFMLAVMLTSLRFKLIIESQGDIKAKYSECLTLTVIGYFFNNFLPTSIGGDVVKAYYLSKRTIQKVQSYTSVLIDRAIGLFTMIFMGFTALIFAKSNIVDPAIKNMIFGITAFSLLSIFFIFNRNFARRFSALLRFVRPMEDKIRRTYNTIHNYKNHKLIMLKSLLISIFSQILFFACMGILARSIGARIPVFDLLLRMPIISAMSLLPSINGLGFREGSTVLVFGPLIGKENAFATSVLLLALLLVMSVFGGLVYALSPQFKVKLKDLT